MAGARNNLALPAHVTCDGRLLCAITISDLSEVRCAVSECLPAAIDSSPLQVWLGAIGPLHAHRSADSASELEFDGPINPAIVAHFNN